jgi:hypothetical protein
MPVSYTSYRAVDSEFSGFLATTKPKQDYVGRVMTPRIRVNSPDFAGKIWVDTHVSAMGTPQSLVVAPGAPLPKMTTADPSTVSYETVCYGLASNGIPKRGAARSKLPVDLVQREMSILQDALLIAEEVRYATLYQTSGNWTTTAACNSLGGAAKWSSRTATPFSDLHEFLETYHAAAHGYFATDICIPWHVAQAMCRTSEVRGAMVLVSSTETGVGQVSPVLTMDALRARLLSELGLRAHFPATRYNTANLGQAHAEGYVWTDTVWLGRLDADAVQDGANIRTVATAALGVDEVSTLISAGLGDMGGIMSAGVDELMPSQGDVYIPYVQHAADELVISADLGATLTDCL